MLCSMCKQKEATIHITRIINGEKEELYLCDDCAKNVEGIDINLDVQPEFRLDSPFTFQSILSGIVDYINKNAVNNEKKPLNLVCKKCKTTFDEFKETGLLGCSECYDNFKEVLNPIVKRIHGNVEHIGKIPKNSGKEIIKKNTINDLKEKLQKAIATEEYEQAAKIRDQIRDIEKNK